MNSMNYFPEENKGENKNFTFVKAKQARKQKEERSGKNKVP